MDWVKITLDTHAQHTDLLCDLLTEAGAVAVTLRNGGQLDLYEPAPGRTPLWPEMQVEGLFEPGTAIETVMERLRGAAQGGQILQCHSTALPDRAWERVCLDDFHPMRYGTRTWVCPSWGSAPSLPGDVVIHLDPGLAFGTGSHATTALCLAWLDQHPPAGRQVIDYGCGSGILGICALKHGAAVVHAVDHDAQALAATLANGQRNGVDQRIKPCLPQQLDARQADILMANIVAGPLVELAGRFADLVRPGGTLILSGVLPHQAEWIIEAYRPWFQVAIGAAGEGWLLLHGTRHAPHPGNRLTLCKR